MLDLCFIVGLRLLVDDFEFVRLVFWYSGFCACGCVGLLVCCFLVFFDFGFVFDLVALDFLV